MKKEQQKPQGRLIAADFLTYTLRALGIGLVAAVVLGGAVVLLAQSGTADDSATGNPAANISDRP